VNVLITGASGGLGRAFAMECAGRGCNLFLTDINEDGLSPLKNGLERRYGVCVKAKACDLTSEESVGELLNVIDSCGIRFDMLLNIAGIDFEGGFMERDRSSVLKIVSLNVEATLRITHAILQRRREGEKFSIVFVSSLASMYPMPLKATYAASKRFLLDFALALRQELREQNVNTLSLCPGGLATTQEAISGIMAQGFWGDITTNRLESVTRRTIDLVQRGKSLYIPGTVNRALSLFGKLVPRPVIAFIIYWRWKNTQKKWLCTSSD